ncbi:recombinase family protein [Candidatus Tisiphia endosymbiont of Nemotelus uliginosus]|uniref:recombinase family protein n=1 Tax=Candidatus Tisiphia endosymbiont of Nemotelus uliginosus TaxID=3077926 RepID=UPI0035C90D60
MTEKSQKATKAILLARVSSKEQEDGYSIEAQKYRLQEYCMRKGLEILQTFEFSESSTVGNRKKFQETIDFAKKQKEVIAIVADKVDRLQRSYKETPLLNDLIERAKIELHFYTENCIIHKHSTSQEKMVWNLFVMMAQSYVDSLRDNVNRSIAQKLRQGEWVSTAPIGYLHIKGSNSRDRGKGKIIVDPNRAPLIKKIFETYATGGHTLPEMLKKTKEWGLRNSRGNQGYLCQSHLYAIITNPFYYGVMRVLKTKKEYQHIYPPIISKELFDTCQAVRLGWNKKPFKYGEKEYIFRGLIKCAATGRIVTAATKKKNYTNGQVGEWTYLRTWDAKNHNRAIYVKEEIILKEVEKVFESLRLEPELLKDVIAYIKSSASIEQGYHKTRISELHAEHSKMKNRLDRLTDLFLDGDLTKEAYEEKRQQLIQKRDDLVKEIANHNNADDKFGETLITLVELASGAGEAFKGSTTEGKRKLINLVFVNLELKDGKLDFKLRPPFDAFVKCTKIAEWRALKDSNL